MKSDFELPFLYELPSIEGRKARPNSPNKFGIRENSLDLAARWTNREMGAAFQREEAHLQAPHQARRRLLDNRMRLTERRTYFQYVAPFNA